MAMICVNGCRECDGCGACQKDPAPLGYCVTCGEAIVFGDDYYEIDGELIHEDCLTDWAAQFRVTA